MLKPHGITITLYDKTETGTDPLGAPIYTETPEEIENVIVAPASSQEILDATNIYGKKAVYTLGIPKGDTHDWTDKKVKIWDKYYRVFGVPLQGIDDIVPGPWNKKVTVETYE